MEEYCKYRDNCAGRYRLVQTGRKLEDLDKTLCNNTHPHCSYFYGYERLKRDDNGVAIGCSMPRGVM